MFEAKSKSYLAIYYYVKGDFDSSDRCFYEAEEILKELGLNTELALHYINILWYKRYEEDKEAVLRYMDKAFEYVQMSASRRDARIYLHLGYIYKTIFGSFIRGIKYLSTAGEMFDVNENREMEAMTLHVMADGYMQLEHYREAVEIYCGIMKDERYRDISLNLQCMMLSNLIYCYFQTDELELADGQIQHMRMLVPYTMTELRGQFFCVTIWLEAKLNIARNDYLDMVPDELRECRDVYEQSRESFYVNDFDYKLCESYGDYYFAIKDVKNALDSYLYQESMAEKYGKLAENKAWKRLAKAYQAAGDKKQAERYRARVQAVYNEVEHSNLVDYYNKISDRFFQS